MEITDPETGTIIFSGNLEECRRFWRELTPGEKAGFAPSDPKIAKPAKKRTPRKPSNASVKDKPIRTLRKKGGKNK